MGLQFFFMNGKMVENCNERPERTDRKEEEYANQIAKASASTGRVSQRRHICYG